MISGVIEYTLGRKLVEDCCGISLLKSIVFK